MKTNNNMKMKLGVFWLVALGASVCWVGCQPAQILVGERSCEAAKWEPMAFSTQDILPGVESNLRAQRLYFIVSTEANHKRLPESNWLLMTDSVQIPLRMIVDSEGGIQWSASRNYYGEVRPGVPVLEKEGLALSGLHLKDEAWLIGNHENGCLAVPLPPVQNLQTIAAP